jgi:hypothetical protein
VWVCGKGHGKEKTCRTPKCIDNQLKEFLGRIAGV